MALGNIALEAATGRGIEDMLRDLAAARAAMKSIREDRLNSASKQALDPLPITLPHEENAPTLAPILDGQIDSFPLEEEADSADPPLSHIEYVTNTDKLGRVHVTLRVTTNLAPVLWTAKCGWRFGIGFNARMNFLDPDKKKCPRCFGFSRKRKEAAQVSDSDSESAN